jgi:precorrin-3B C17-methyltransferase
VKNKGKLFVVGIGPGDISMISQKAAQAIKSATFVCGYEPYVEQIKVFISPFAKVFSNKMKGEIERVKIAISAFNEGEIVALVCGGDASLYSMASLVLELTDDTNNIEIIAGITAVLAASAKLGAPISDDLLIISMSDLLTPWELIKKRIDAANYGDLVCGVYNPRSRKRTYQFPYLINKFYEERGNLICGYVKNCDRKNEEIKITKIKRLNFEDIDMSTIIIVGNTKSFIKQGKIITPRGYTKKYT